MPGEVASRWRYRDGGGEIGVISSVTQPFCGTARALGSRPRASSTPASSARDGVDLRAPLRAGADDDCPAGGC